MAPLLLLWAFYHCFSPQAAAGGAAAVTDKEWASKLRYRMKVSCDSWLQPGAQEERVFFFCLLLQRWLKRVHQQKQSSTCLLECSVHIQQEIFNHSKWIFIHFSLAVPFLGRLSHFETFLLSDLKKVWHFFKIGKIFFQNLKKRLTGFLIMTLVTEITVRWEQVGQSELTFWKIQIQVNRTCFVILHPLSQTNSHSNFWHARNSFQGLLKQSTQSSHTVIFTSSVSALLCFFYLPYQRYSNPL